MKILDTIFVAGISLLAIFTFYILFRFLCIYKEARKIVYERSTFLKIAILEFLKFHVDINIVRMTRVHYLISCNCCKRKFMLTEGEKKKVFANEEIIMQSKYMRYREGRRCSDI